MDKFKLARLLLVLYASGFVFSACVVLVLYFLHMDYSLVLLGLFAVLLVAGIKLSNFISDLK